MKESILLLNFHEEPFATGGDAYATAFSSVFQTSDPTAQKVFRHTLCYICIQNAIPSPHIPTASTYVGDGHIT